jgi:hypothetical protein
MLRWGVPHHKIFKYKNTMKKKNTADTRNSKILQATMVTLGALKEESPALEELAINEIQVHLLDEDGDGVVLCLEYDEHGELSKTFSNVDEYYEEIEVELEDSDEDEGIESFIEEAISEEYDEVLSEVFHSSESKPPLLN